VVETALAASPSLALLVALDEDGNEGRHVEARLPDGLEVTAGQLEDPVPPSPRAKTKTKTKIPKYKLKIPVKKPSLQNPRQRPSPRLKQQLKGMFGKEPS
jgi:hypothetical protein